MINKILLFTLYCLLIIKAGWSQTTVTLNATLSGKVTNANVKTDGGISNICSSCDRGYVKFDLSSIPYGAVITSATLKLSAIVPSVNSGVTNTITSTTLDAATPGAGFYTALGSATSAFSGNWSFSSLPNTFSLAINTAGITALSNRVYAGNITYGIIRGSTNVYHFAGYNDATVSLQPQLVVTYTNPVPCSGTPTAGTASATLLDCSGSSSIALSGTTIAGDIGFQWQEFDGTDWVNAIGGTGSTTNVYVTPAITLSKQYRCMVTCSGSGLSAITNDVTINPVTINAGTISSNKSITCMGSSVILSSVGSSTGTGFTYQWQEFNGSTWINAVGGTGANSLIYTTPALSANKQYRLYVSCSLTGNYVTTNEVAVTVIAVPSNRLYVTTTGNGTQDGSNWANAIQLGDALKNAYVCTNVNELFIQAGTYYPKYQSNMTDTIGGLSRFATFYITSGVKIYGGFAGTETSLAERNSANIWGANKTILSGDLGIIGNKNDNVYHVVYMINPSASTQLNDLQVAYGYANGAASNDTHGAGIFIDNTNTATGQLGPQVNKIIVSNNFSASRGGGMYYRLNTNATINFKLTNSVFAEDTSNGGFGGGAIRFDGAGGSYTGTDSIINCVFYRNTGEEGGAIKMDHGGSGLFKTYVINSTFYGNVSSVGNDLAVWSPSVNGEFYLRNSICYSARTLRSLSSARFYISNSIVNGSNAAGFYNANIINAGNVKAEDPKFMSIANIVGADNIWGTSDDGLQISECSNARDFGLNTDVPVNIASDITGANRIYNNVVDMGAYEASTSGNYVLASTNISQTVSVDGTTQVYNNLSNCELIASITPQGASPVSGNTNFKVMFETIQPAQFVKRHYEITPASNTAAATAKVTLYFTQQEFDDFNAVNTVDLPTSAADVTGIANLLIEKRPGTSSDGSGLPNTYTGTPVTINPTDADISWNATANRWEVSFDVTGFSGFFVKTLAGVLPIRWLQVNATINNNKQAVINWQLQEANITTYQVEKSLDGNNFKAISTLQGKGTGTNSYSFTEANTLLGKAYYRVKQIDVNGSYSYSTIMQLNNELANALIVYPVPFKEGFTVVSKKVAPLVITRANGQIVKTIQLTQGSNYVLANTLSTGMYILKTADGYTQKIIKE
jgi:hypothetical protein